MKTWNELTIAERKEEAEKRMPPLFKIDNSKVNLRKVYIERAILGVQRLNESQLERVYEIGYDAFFIEKVNKTTHAGLKRYQHLISINRIDLTSEHIAFHNFRKKLKNTTRMKIAKLLADYYTNNQSKK